ncbi:MAG: ISL3 family transposase, partial [Planctomycetota bacterium]
AVATGGDASGGSKRSSPPLARPPEWTARCHPGPAIGKTDTLGQNARMQDIQLYEQILGLEEPWRVKQVTLNRTAAEVQIEVECLETVWGCPQCQQRMHVHGWEKRRWRHLDSCQFKTIILAEVPQVRCAEHGTQTVAVPWAEKYARLTRRFERLAIDVMKECSILGACEILRISWDEADGIKQRAVARGLARKEPRVMKRLCVDEKAVGVGHQYMTIVAEITPETTARVESVGEERTQASLDAFWRSLTDEQLQGVEAVAMDLWEPYLSSTRAHVPEAEGKICHDPYHLVSPMNDALNQVRKREHQSLSQQGDASLAGSRYTWLYGWENLPENKQVQWQSLSGQGLKTARAWRIKEAFRWFWWLPNRAQASAYLQEWYGWAVRSRLEPVKKVARMFKRHWERILNYFDHHLTNGPMEGLNNKIQSLIKKAYGYRNKQRFKTDVLFHLGGLDLYPAQ